MIPIVSSDFPSKYFIVTVGRTGSSLLCAVLADASADFGMKAPEDWDPRRGVMELRVLTILKSAALGEPENEVVVVDVDQLQKSARGEGQVVLQRGLLAVGTAPLEDCFVGALGDAGRVPVPHPGDQEA